MAINFFNQASFNDVEMQEDLSPSRRLLETDLYRGKIKQVYLDAPNEGGAAFLNVTINIMEDSSGHKIAPAFEYSQRLYVTNREGCPYFVSKTTGKQIMMPGAQIMNELSLLYLGKALKDLGEGDVEERKIKIHNFKADSDETREVTVYTAFDNLEVAVLIRKVKDFKYQSDDIVENNDIIKFVDLQTLATYSEKEKEQDPRYVKNYLGVNKGRVYDKTTKSNKQAKDSKPAYPTWDAAFNK